MSILEELYNGKIAPFESYIKDRDEYQKINNLLQKDAEQLFSSLNDDEKELYKKISDSLSQLSYICEKESFTEGFCIGAKLMLEVLNYKT